MIRKFVMLAAVGAIGMSLAACGQTVESGNVGVKIKNFGSNAGVQSESLPTGWQPVGIGETIVQYPIITRTYQWTRGRDGDHSENEEFAFNDSTGLPLTADLSITFKMDPQKVPEIYKTYKLDFDALRNGPIRAYVRTAIALEASKYTSDQLYTSKRQEVVQNALLDVQKHFANSGVEITDLQWIGSIRFPDSVQHAIERKTAADQEAQVADQQLKVAEAQNKIKMQNADADAYVTQKRGDALRSNPQIIQQEWVAKWDGHLPQYMTGGDSHLLMQIPSKN